MTAMAPSAQAYAESAVTKTLESLDSRKRPDLEAGETAYDAACAVAAGGAADV